MKQQMDLSSWWTPDRIEAEDAVWRRDGFYIQYAAEIRELMNKLGLKTVLEVGCGTGYVGNELKNEFDYVGTDGSGLMIQFAREKHPDVKFEVLNIRDMDNPAMVPNHGNIDLVCCFAVFKHFTLEDWPIILSNILGVAKHALIQVQIRQSGHPSVEDGAEVPHNWISVDELIQFCESIGHEVLAVKLTDKDVSPYMANAAEGYLITKKREGSFNADHTEQDDDRNEDPAPDGSEDGNKSKDPASALVGELDDKIEEGLKEKEKDDEKKDPEPPNTPAGTPDGTAKPDVPPVPGPAPAKESPAPKDKDKGKGKGRR